MKKAWELFPKVTELARQDHVAQGVLNSGGHPFYHALLVAQYTLLIANNERVGELAALAALMHNLDRMFPEDQVQSRIGNYIAAETVINQLRLSQSEIDIVSNAVLNHHKKNDPSDSPVLVCLKDADRLANISPFEITARSARAYCMLPVINPRFLRTTDPEATYREPRTVFHDSLVSTLEWEPWLRLPKAIKLGRKYFDLLRAMRESVSMQFEETGLIDYYK